MGDESKSSVLDSSNETINGTKLMRLILDGGTEALRNVFRTKHPGDLKVVLDSHEEILSDLMSSNVIRQNQWDKLFPVPPSVPNINDFDITLLSVLLRSICSLSPPPSGWNKMPDVSDTSDVADVIRIKLFRNERFGHIATSAISTADFKSFWKEISEPLVRLGIDQNEINRLEKEKCGPEEVARVLNDWKEYNLEVMDTLEVILNVLNEQQNAIREMRASKSLGEIQSDDVVNKHLVKCDFKTEVKLSHEKFVNGTREWVFEKLESWFNNKTPTNRAFVITGRAGTGKSIIAAVICKRLAEHVGASHFFQWNNSQYSSPKFFLQSLAWHLCRALPAYKEALVEKLSGNLGQPLNDMNILGLFSTILKEPFSCIADPEKHILIVLDGFDEVDVNGRHELANLISSHVSKLPSYIRFVITTRPEEKLLQMFAKFSPLFIEISDQRNLHDIKLVLQERISSANRHAEDLIDSLVQRSGGLMLYAFFVTADDKIDEENWLQNTHSLPIGIEQCYENYFNRLEHEVNVLNISKVNFFSFICALAATKQPLPQAFLQSLFGVENLPMIRQALNSLSSFFEIRDQSISFYHKSIRDWLVDNSKHDYSVDVQGGNKILFDLCVEELDRIKANGVSREISDNPGISYALKHCISHMLDGVEDSTKIQRFVSHYVADLEYVFASVSVSVDLTLKNITSLSNHKLYLCVPEDTKTIVNDLFSLIRKFGFSLHDYPQMFLQTVVNEGGKELSLKATNLLQTRYKDIIYLELFNKDDKSSSFEACIPLSGTVLGMDISPKHEYVVCKYEEGGVIELFSLATCRSEWKIQDVASDCLDLPEHTIRMGCLLQHAIVFHPHTSLILPGRLNRVLTYEGTWTEGPFQVDEQSSVFNDCCFSLDGSKMVTYNWKNVDNCFFVWNLHSGNKESCIPYISSHPPLSFSFTANGKFLGTVSFDGYFTVYEVENNYEARHRSLWGLALRTSFRSHVIVSTSDQNSWICGNQERQIVVNYDLSLSEHPSVRYTGLIVPYNVFSSDIQLQCSSSALRRYLNIMFGWSNSAMIRYALIDDERVLVFSPEYKIVYICRPEGLINTFREKYTRRAFSDMSTNGDFLYLRNGHKQEFTIYKRDTDGKYSLCGVRRELFLLVVRLGVILFGKNRTLELWSYDLTQQLRRFDQLVETLSCFPVSDEVIACFNINHTVLFFNLVTEQIVHRIPLDGKYIVIACSVHYYVLTKARRGDDGEIHLRRNGDSFRLDVKWESTPPKSKQRLLAEFSPKGHKLVLSRIGFNSIFVFDAFSGHLLAKIPILPLSTNLSFFSNQYFLCGTTGNMVYIIDVERAEIPTCLSIGSFPEWISVCCERNMVFVPCGKWYLSGNAQLMNQIMLLLIRNAQTCKKPALEKLGVVDVLV